MKLYTYEKDGAKNIGIGYDESTLYPQQAFGLSFVSMLSLIRTITPAEYDRLRTPAHAANAPLALADVRLLAPLSPDQDILCVGVNYKAHAEESERYHKEAFGRRPLAVYFSKRATVTNGDGGVVPRYEGLVESLDYEAELAVILGRDAQNVTEQDAAEYVFGYTIHNDISARDLQTEHGQWYFGKSLDGFSCIGPCIVTADEIAFPPALDIRGTVSGELRQHSNTSEMIHGIAQIISELSCGMTLRAGTMISTGTPEGVGMGFHPPKFLKKGDVVTCEIEKIGSITNHIE